MIVLKVIFDCANSNTHSILVKCNCSAFPYIYNDTCSIQAKDVQINCSCLSNKWSSNLFFFSDEDYLRLEKILLLHEIRIQEAHSCMLAASQTLKTRRQTSHFKLQMPGIIVPLKNTDLWTFFISSIIMSKASSSSSPATEQPVENKITAWIDKQSESPYPMWALSAASNYIVRIKFLRRNSD